MSEFQIEGMDELLNRLAQLGRNIDGVIEPALKEAGDNVKEEMKRFVQVSNINHEHIRDDIQTSDIKGRGKEKYIEIGPSKKTSWRANFLEFGTVKMSAKPFIEPSHLRTREENKQIIVNKIREALGI